MEPRRPLDTAAISLTRIKESLKKPSLHVVTRPDSIIVFTFDNLAREVLIQWMDYLKANSETWQSPLRILYDFRSAGAPSRFMIDRVPKVLAEIPFPDDTRTAYLFDDGTMARFTRNALRAMPACMGVTREFMNLDPALYWLHEGL